MAWTKPGPGRIGTPRAGGTTNEVMKRVAEARKFARNIVENDAYRAALMQRAIAGTLHPHVETMLFYYAFGKPAENVVLSRGADEAQADLPELTDADLLKRIQLLADAIREDKKASAHLIAAAEAQRDAEAVAKARKVN